MKVRKFKPEEWRKIIQLWNRTLASDPISEDIFHKWLLTDPNYDPDGFRVLESGGEIRAAVIGWYQITNSIFSNSLEENKDRGFIFPLLVDDTNEGFEYGNALLNDIDNYFREHRKRSIHINGLMPLFPDGADSNLCPLYLSNGYVKVGEIYSMRADLYRYCIDATIKGRILEMEKEGFTFTDYNSDDMPAILDFFIEENQEFRLEFQKKLQWGAPHDEFLFVKKGKKVVGYCQHNHYGYQPERTGPFMVATSMRGERIGQAMVAKLLESMAFKGFHYAYFNTCEKHLCDFYAKNGYRIFREKCVLKKSL